jgi:hypothetical protein
LEGATTESGKTFLEALAHYYDDLSIGILKDLAGMTVFEEGLEEYIVSKIPRISGYSKAVGLISEIVEPLMIGWDLWEKFLEDQERTAQTWEEIGRVTAMRQWLRALIDLTRRRENDFPDKIEIDLSTVAGESVYYVARYFAEQRATDGVASEFVYATNRMKKGFDEGVKQMDAAGDEMIATADKFIVDLLHDSGIFDPCKINVLRNAGLLEMSRCRARALRYMADKMLDELPHV